MIYVGAGFIPARIVSFLYHCHFDSRPHFPCPEVCKYAKTLLTLEFLVSSINYLQGTTGESLSRGLPLYGQDECRWNTL
jgi:hypothetical protein